ncbi:hypothetical protein ABPG72_009857 [Tetrahymena utriculariae]
MFKLKRLTQVCLPLMIFSSSKTIYSQEKRKKEELCALLIGSTGSGKSFIGNMILGEKVFKTASTSGQRTLKNTKIEKNVIIDDKEYKITLIDCVGFFDQEKNNLDNLEELIKTIKSLSKVNKLIYAYPYGERTDNSQKKLLKALSYCMNSTSSSLLCVINKVEDEYNYQDLSNEDGYSQQNNCIRIKNQVKEYWGQDFDTFTMQKFTKKDENVDSVRKEYQKILINKILCGEPLNKKLIQTWSEFYNSILQNKKQYHEKQIDNFKCQIEKNQTELDNINNSLKNIKSLVPIPFDPLLTTQLWMGVEFIKSIVYYWYVYSDKKQLRKHEEILKDLQNNKTNQQFEAQLDEIKKIDNFLRD